MKNLFALAKNAMKAKVAAPEFALSNPASFYTGVKKVTGPLTQQQVATINGLLKACGDWPLPWTAYALATAHHECRFLPIKERGGWNYLAKYDTGRLARILGNTPEADGDGQRYAGRGLVQLTGKTNYRKAGEYLGLDLVGNPDLALNPDNAAKILVWGMSTGAFTGKSLLHYIPRDGATIDDYRAARRIINGTDRADLIAGHALAFGAALFHGGWR